MLSVKPLNDLTNYTENILREDEVNATQICFSFPENHIFSLDMIDMYSL